MDFSGLFAVTPCFCDVASGCVTRRIFDAIVGDTPSVLQVIFASGQYFCRGKTGGDCLREFMHLLDIYRVMLSLAVKAMAPKVLVWLQDWPMFATRDDTLFYIPCLLETVVGYCDDPGMCLSVDYDDDALYLLHRACDIVEFMVEHCRAMLSDDVVARCLEHARSDEDGQAEIALALDRWAGAL